jgi:hypothetical protein
MVSRSLPIAQRNNATPSSITQTRANGHCLAMLNNSEPCRRKKSKKLVFGHDHNTSAFRGGREAGRQVSINQNSVCIQSQVLRRVVV